MCIRDSYRAANIAFENVLEDFPSTKLRPKIYDYILKSRYELAANSVYDLKKDRIENALSFTKQVEREMPSSENAKTAKDLRAKLEKEKTDFLQLEKKVEERRTELLKKQREAEAEKNLPKEKEIAETLKKDSIQQATK